MKCTKKTNIYDYKMQLEKIVEEVKGLTFIVDVWEQLINIERKSEHFKQYDRHLQEWLNINYSTTVVIKISKITEKPKRSDDENIIKFLESIKNDEKFGNIKDIDKDIEKINKIYASLEKIRHKKIAHSTKTVVSSKITHNDILEYTKIIQEITKKYYSLLFNAQIVFSFYDLNVKWVFMEPWIKNP